MTPRAEGWKNREKKHQKRRLKRKTLGSQCGDGENEREGERGNVYNRE